MPVYQYEGKHYDLPDGLTNEQAISKIESYLGKAPSKEAATQAPSPEQQPSTGDESWLDRLNKAMTPSYTGGIVSGLSKGYTDPIQGIAQLALKGGAALGIPGAEAGAEQMRQREIQYEQARQKAGGGFDVARLAGNIVNPANYIAPGTTAFTNPLARSAATGAIQAAMQPVASEEYWSSKALQAGLGAAVGPLLEGGVQAFGKIADAVKGFTKAGRTEAMQKYVSDLAGPEKEQVIKALQDAKELVSGSRPTSAEVLSDIPSAAELIAAQTKLAGKEGVARSFIQRSTEQQAARVRAIQSIAGTEAERAAVATARDTATGTMRETALAQADLAAPVYTKLEKEVMDGFNSLAAAEQTSGMIGLASKTKQAVAEAGKPGWLTAGDIAAEAQKTAGAYSQKAQTIRMNTQLKQYQLKSLEENGFFPLKVSDITDRIDSAIKGTSSDTSKTVLKAVRDTLTSKADENGIIGSRDLYENVRKMSNQDIAKLLNLGDQYASGGIPEQAAKALGNVKKYIDSALDKSTDGLWSQYLNKYSEYSTKINRMEIGDFLSKKLQTPLDKERAGVFANAVENAAGTIKRSTGIPRYQKLEQVMTTQEVGTINNVLADLSRKTKADEIASKVGALEPGTTDVAAAVPPWIDRGITVLKEGLRYLQRGNQKEFNNRMAELMLNPSQMAQLLTEGVPKGKMNKTIELIYGNLDDTMKGAFIQNFGTTTTGQVAGQ